MTSTRKPVTRWIAWTSSWPLAASRVALVASTRMEAEWAGPSYVWAAEDRPQSGKRSVRIRSAELERRGVWLIRAEFSVEPRPI